MLLRLRMAALNQFAACKLSDDGSDRSRVGCAPSPREHVVDAMGHLLIGELVMLCEVYIPEHSNSHCCALFDCNHEYASAKIADKTEAS